MNILMPMAGRGSRFQSSGYSIPKPFIPVNGKPMFAWALESIKQIQYTKLYITALKEHESKYQISKLVDRYIKNYVIKYLEKTPSGQLISALSHRDHIDTREDVLIISSDTLVISHIHDDIRNKQTSVAGIISVADMPGDMWSFVKTNSKEEVIEVAEKIRISNYASTGLYYFAHGDEFISYADQLIKQRKKVNNEYYVIPVYSEYLKDGRKISISRANEMWDMGTPNSLKKFISSKLETGS